MRCLFRSSLLALVLVLAGTAVAAPPDAVRLGPGSEPRLAVDGSGGLIAVYGRDGQVFVQRSTDDGATWSAARPIDTLTGKIAIGMRRGPRVAVAADALVVSVIRGEQGGGHDGDLVVVRSNDSGLSWSTPTTVSDQPNAAREGLHDLTAGHDGKRLVATWLDLRERGTAIFASTSEDGGRTWSANVAVYRSPDGHVCECCHPSAIIEPSGRIDVMFRNWIAGNRDMYVASSDDGGTTWTAAYQLGVDHWQLDACPMDGGALVLDSAGTVHAIWRSRDQVQMATLPAEGVVRDGTTITKGTQPVAVTTSQGTWYAWLEGRTLQRRFEGVQHESGEQQPLAGAATDPVLIARGDTVWCAWASGGSVYVRKLN